jgi:hypothetical protein
VVSKKTSQRLDVVQGEDRAADRAAHFDRHMTEEARQEGITHRIRVTSRSVYEEWLREERLDRRPHDTS